MPIAEIIAIGTELLLGEIQDTNTAYLARKLRDIGVNLYRATLIGDNESRISGLIQEAMQRADIVITTGGLGPTVDDPTRQAVAAAVHSNLEFRQDLWNQIEERFTRFNRKPTENNRRQAYVPANALSLENPVGTAPSFLVDTATSVIICLPGVPREMEAIFERSVHPYLKERFALKGLIKVRVLHLAGIGESQIDELIGDMETYTNPTVGLLAKSGQIDVRITMKAESEEEADRKILEVETLLRQRLGSHVYGADRETLESLLKQELKRLEWHISVAEYGLGGLLADRLAPLDLPAHRIVVRGGPCHIAQAQEELPWFRESLAKMVILVAFLTVGKEKHSLEIYIRTPELEKKIERFYGGPPTMAPTWAVNMALDCLRRILQKAV